MASVTFPVSVGGDGSTVTDDSNASTGLANGGHRTRFVPALAQVVAVAEYVVDTASALNQGQTWAFDSSTTMADPGTGDLRFNDATTASISQVAVSALSAASGNPDISAIITTWDDSTNTSNKGYLTFRKGGEPEVFVTFIISGSITDNTTWLQIPVTYVGHNGSWAAADQMFSEFARSGDKGVDGAGDVTSNTASTSVDNEIVLFDGVGGKTIKRSTTTGIVKATSGVISAATAGTDYVAPGTATTFTADQTGGDNDLIQWNLKDVSSQYNDKGTVVSGTVTFNYTDGSHQRLQVGGALTIATSTWPPTGTNGSMLVELVNGASATVTWPTVNWVKSDGTTTTTFASNGVTLQASGTDFFVLWTRDAGTTIYGKFVR